MMLHKNSSISTFFILSLLVLLCVLTVIAQPITQVKQDEKNLPSESIPFLEPDKPIERELKSGEAHPYQVALKAGQFTHIIATSKGIDVGIILYGQDDKKIIEINFIPSLSADENLFWIAKETQMYKIEIKSVRKEITPGKYEVKIAELRNSTPLDEKQIIAQQTVIDTPLMYIGNLSRQAKLKAIEKNLDIIPLLKAVKNQEREAYLLANIASVYRGLGEYQKALEYYNQALPIYKTANIIGGEGATLHNLALIYGELGEYQKAMDYSKQALPIRRAIGDRLGESFTVSSIGVIYNTLGEYQKALEFYNQALSILHEVGDPLNEIRFLNNIGIVYSDLGENQKALEFYNQALSIAGVLKDRLGEAIIFNNIGIVYSNLGENQKALEFYNQALSISRSIEDQRREAFALNEIGRIYRNLKEYKKALDYHSQALTLSHITGYSILENSSLFNVAIVLDNLEEPQKALEAIEQAIKIIEATRSKIISQELRNSFSASNRAYYEFYIYLLMKLHKQHPSEGYLLKALEANERAKARLLIELLNESKADIRQGVDITLVEQERSLRLKINLKAETLLRLKSSKAKEEEIKEVEKEIDELSSELQETLSEIRKKSPRYAALTQPQPLTAKEIQQLLDENNILLEYSLSEYGSYIWLVTQNNISSFELPKSSDIETLAKEVRELLIAYQPIAGQSTEQYNERVSKANTTYWPKATELSKTLLGQVTDKLSNKRLIIVADGILHYLPFAALPLPNSTVDNQKYLISEHEIINLPSASTLAILRKDNSNNKPATKTLAVFADPIFSNKDNRLKTLLAKTKEGKETKVAVKEVTAETKISEELSASALLRSLEDVPELRSEGSFSRLLFSRQEANALNALCREGESKVAIDFTASLSNATSEDISQYRYIHFATHGILNSSHPELSGIVLSRVNEQGEDINGFLRLQDIFNLKMPSELVVLSACQTGLGKEIKGEGLVGLTRGFMYAGAKRVVASLWKVDDAATAELMKLFYQGMLGDKKLTPPAALRAAQLEMMKKKRYQAPFFWAAFTLQGEFK